MLARFFKTTVIFIMLTLFTDNAFGETRQLVVALDKISCEKISKEKILSEIENHYKDVETEISIFQSMDFNNKKNLRNALSKLQNQCPLADIVAFYFREKQPVIAILKPGSTEIMGRLFDVSGYEQGAFESFFVLALKSSLIEIKWREKDKSAPDRIEAVEEKRQEAAFSFTLKLKEPVEDSPIPPAKDDDSEKLKEEPLEVEKETPATFAEQTAQKVEEPAAPYSFSVAARGLGRYQPSAKAFTPEIGAGLATSINDGLVNLEAGAGYCFSKNYSNEKDYDVSVSRIPVFLEAGSTVYSGLPSVSLAGRLGGEIMYVNPDESLLNEKQKWLFNPFISAVEKVSYSPAEWVDISFMLEQRVFIRREDFVINMSGGEEYSLYQSERIEFLAGVGFEFGVWESR